METYIEAILTLPNKTMLLEISSIERIDSVNLSKDEIKNTIMPGIKFPKDGTIDFSSIKDYGDPIGLAFSIICGNEVIIIPREQWICIWVLNPNKKTEHYTTGFPEYVCYKISVSYGILVLISDIQKIYYLTEDSTKLQAICDYLNDKES